MHWEASCSAESRASAGDVWSALVDGRRWPDWNGRFEWMWLEGPLAPGTVATLKPRGYRQTAFVVEAVEPERLFALVARFGPVARVRVAFALEPFDGGTYIRHSVGVDGPLGGIALRMMARRLADDAQAAIDGLARYAAPEKEKAR